MSTAGKGFKPLNKLGQTSVIREWQRGLQRVEVLAALPHRSRHHRLQLLPQLRRRGGQGQG